MNRTIRLMPLALVWLASASAATDGFYKCKDVAGASFYADHAFAQYNLETCKLLAKAPTPEDCNPYDLKKPQFKLASDHIKCQIARVKKEVDVRKVRTGNWATDTANQAYMPVFEHRLQSEYQLLEALLEKKLSPLQAMQAQEQLNTVTSQLTDVVNQQMNEMKNSMERAASAPAYIPTTPASTRTDCWWVGRTFTCNSR